MRAVVLEGHGGPEVLQVREVPDVEPGPDEVLVAVAATAVNRADLLQRMGLYPDPTGPAEHEIPGLEFAGTVRETGSRVRHLSVGDRVMGITSGGAYAELVAIHERQAMSIPESVELADAAAIPEVWITAWDAIVRQGGMRSGARVLVHAGASGVGTAAIQIVRALGAQVAVTASTAKVDPCRALGANLVIDYTKDDFVPAVREWTGSTGVDVVLDVVGADYLERNLDCLRTGGTIVQVGVMAPGPVEFSLGKMLPKRATLIGTVLRARPVEEKIAVSREFAAQILPFFNAGMARPVIDTRFPLERVPEAHARMQANANVGKILLEVA